MGNEKLKQGVDGFEIWLLVQDASQIYEHSWFKNKGLMLCHLPELCVLYESFGDI